MMNQYEVPVFIAGKLPQVKTALICKQRGNVYQSVQVLTDYTKKMVIEHDLKMVERCIFSFSSIWALCNIAEWRIIQSYMPSGLYILYMKQVLS